MTKREYQKKVSALKRVLKAMLKENIVGSEEVIRAYSMIDNLQKDEIFEINFNIKIGLRKDI